MKKSPVEFMFLPAHPGVDAVRIVKVDKTEIGELSQAPDGTYWFHDYSEGDDLYFSPRIDTLAKAEDAIYRHLRILGYVEGE